MTTPKELAKEFRRLAAKASAIAEAAPHDGPDVWSQSAYIWERAAQMVEERLDGGS